jgi:hypothetical protein
MDLEAANIRAEMSQTRQALDSKIDRFEDKLRELTPRRYWERHRPEFLLDRAIGGALTLAGLIMAWNLFRSTRGSHATRRSNEDGPAYWGERRVREVDRHNANF